MKRELEALEDSDHALEKLEARRAETETRLLSAGRKLLGSRIEGASRLSSEVAAELQDLEMRGARLGMTFQFSVKDADKDLLAAADPDGFGSLEFLISANPGEPLKPLARIASGGEISRIMLALKSVLSKGEQVGTLVFDEIDIGIGGEAAKTLAVKLKSLSRVRQVFCVTHLPQIAGLADRHYAVEKTSSGGRTSTRVRLLTGEERVREVARMMAGARPSTTALDHARELIASGVGKGGGRRAGRGRL
jgi:DNA repair protein RecN (Recombination protein N)